MIVSHCTILDLLCAHLAGRTATRTDIESMPYLAMAIVEVNEGRPTMVRDIIERREE